MYLLFVKRIIDFAGALLLGLLLLPVYVVVAVGVWWDLGWPVLFRQKRSGLKGAPFWLLKFRSMRNTADQRGTLLADALRTTRFGALLRKTSLDELPSIWNVLRGHMSLVGPRPLLVEYRAYLTPGQARRLQVRPGITGWAAVNGRNAQSWESIFSRDVWYVDHLSLLLDLRILFRTVVTVLKRQGVERGPHDSNSPFAARLASDTPTE